jgi:hypothetical protein
VKLNSFVVGLTSLLLAGCSSNLLGGGSPAPAQSQQVAVNNELALPPDLALRAPGTAAPAYKTPSEDAVYSDTPAAPVAPQRSLTARPSPAQAAFDKYNISPTKPDGTAKTEWEMREELRKAVIAEKRKTNPNYGTVFNTGGLFNDQ